MASLVSSIKRKLESIFSLSAYADGTDGDAAGIPSDGDCGAALSSSSSISDGRPRKRPRLHFAGAATPRLLSESTPPLLPSSRSKLLPSKELFLSGNDDYDDDDDDENGRRNHPSALLRLLPADVLSHCLSYVSSPSDRFGIQVSCATLKILSDGEGMLATLELGGDVAEVANAYSPFDNVGGNDGQVLRVRDGDGGVADEPAAEDEEDDARAAARRISPGSRPPSTAAGGIISDDDTSETACEKLVKFAAAGNMQAIYMIAMILCYCHENIPEGLALLRHAASSGHLPSTYALALILRDSRQVESDYYLNAAASMGHAPAWQEKLTAAEMRARFGDVDAKGLVRYLDPPCLNRLLGRHYLGCRRARKHQTSHCWNPLCGRWAYKALRVENGRRARRAMFHALLNERVPGGVGQGDNIGPVRRGDPLGAGDDDNLAIQRQLPGARHGILEPANVNNVSLHDLEATNREVQCQPCQHLMFSIETLLPPATDDDNDDNKNNKNDEKLNPDADFSSEPSPLEKLREALRNKQPQAGGDHGLKVSRMKMCSSCRRAKYCSKLCQVYDWRSGRHKMECQFL